MGVGVFDHKFKTQLAAMTPAERERLDKSRRKRAKKEEKDKKKRFEKALEEEKARVRRQVSVFSRPTNAWMIIYVILLLSLSVCLCAQVRGVNEDDDNDDDAGAVGGKKKYNAKSGDDYNVTAEHMEVRFAAC